MSSSERARHLLRWYPPAWRRRYGDEFAALLTDVMGDAAPSVRLRLDVIRSGIAMRLRDVGLSGDGTPPTEWIRGGALGVLCAWSIFVVAGIGLQKTAEHWQDVVPASARTGAEIAFATVQVVAAIASLLVVAGAVAVLPALARFLGAGGWAEVRRPFLRAVATCGVTAVALGGLVWWAHRLSAAQRNGADVAYGLGALLFGLLVVASIATVTAAGVHAVRRIRLSPSVLRLEGHLAEAVTGAMIVIAAAACVWWGIMAASVPWFFVRMQMIMVTGLMLAAVILAALGTRRVIAGRRELPDA